MSTDTRNLMPNASINDHWGNKRSTTYTDPKAAAAAIRQSLILHFLVHAVARSKTPSVKKLTRNIRSA
ncbi:hypothetical protein D3C75_1123220 [compost metagenome]